MIFLKTLGDTVQAKVENRGWETIPSGAYNLRISDDRSKVFLRASSSFLFEIENYPVSNILNSDDGDTPFTADTLEAYLIDKGFFSHAPSDGYGTGQYMTAISNIPQNINNTEAPVLFQNVLNQKGITLLNDSEFVFEKAGLITVFFEFNVDIASGNADLEFWVEAFNEDDGIFQPNTISGNVFELTGKTEGTKTYIYQSDVLANVRYRLVAATQGDVTFTSHPLATNGFVSTIGAKLRIR